MQSPQATVSFAAAGEALRKWCRPGLPSADPWERLLRWSRLERPAWFGYGDRRHDVVEAQRRLVATDPRLDSTDVAILAAAFADPPSIGLASSDALVRNPAVIELGRGFGVRMQPMQ